MVILEIAVIPDIVQIDMFSKSMAADLVQKYILLAHIFWVNVYIDVELTHHF